MTDPPIVVIGMGNPMRRDDGIGHVALERLGRLPELDERQVELVALDGEATRLIAAWRGRRRAIVIDAGRAGAAPGTVHRLEAGVDRLPGWTESPSSHTAGLAEAVALGDALGALPDQLIVLGVEAEDLSMGEGLSPAVEAALPALVERIHAEVAT